MSGCFDERDEIYGLVSSGIVEGGSHAIRGRCRVTNIQIAVIEHLRYCVHLRGTSPSQTCIIPEIESASNAQAFHADTPHCSTVAAYSQAAAMLHHTASSTIPNLCFAPRSTGMHAKIHIGLFESFGGR